MVAREYMPYSIAARELLGISPTVLRAAMERGELKAKIKPITRGRKDGAARTKDTYFVSRDAVKAWFDDYWEDYTPNHR